MISGGDVASEGLTIGHRRRDANHRPGGAGIGSGARRCPRSTPSGAAGHDLPAGAKRGATSESARAVRRFVLRAPTRQRRRSSRRSNGHPRNTGSGRIRTVASPRNHCFLHFRAAKLPARADDRARREQEDGRHRVPPGRVRANCNGGATGNEESCRPSYRCYPTGSLFRAASQPDIQQRM
jgi:hypothetical protein